MAGFLLLIIAVLRLFPGLPFTRMLHAGLVEAPVAWLAGLRRRHLIFGAILLALLVFGSEFLAVLGPGDALLVFTWDLSLYVDAAIVAWTLSTIGAAKAAYRLAVRRCASIRRGARGRARRTRRVVDRRAANDRDADAAGWSYALAA